MELTSPSSSARDGAKLGIIHMGLPKTATTSIQNAVYLNREILLSDHRMLYPSIEANHTNSLCAMFLPDPRTHVSVKLANLTTDQEINDLRQRYFGVIEAEIENTDWDTLVFSAEGLSNLPYPSLVQLHEWVSKYVDALRVIYWTRHPVNFTISNIQQMVRGGYTIEGLLKSPPLTNFKGRLDNAFRAFGESAVEIYCFEEARDEDGGVVAAFCRQLGLPEDVAAKIAADARHDNTSMTMMATLILDALNRYRPLYIDGKLNPQRHPLEGNWLERLEGGRFDLDPASKQMIRAASREEVSWLNATLGTAFYTDVFRDEVTDFAPLKEQYSEEMLLSMALMISDLINYVYGDKQ